MVGIDCNNIDCKNPLCDCDPCDCTEEVPCKCCVDKVSETTPKAWGDSSTTINME